MEVKEAAPEAKTSEKAADQEDFVLEAEQVEETEVLPGKEKRPVSGQFQKWLIRFGLLFVLILIAITVMWMIQRPAKVELIQPVQATITETITSSGIVGGTTETNVGAQSQGIVQVLFVKEGDEVIGGQKLAMIKNDVAEAQISQAQAAVSTARSQLVQVSRGALPSDINAASQQVQQAIAQAEQQRAIITQAERNVAQTKSQLDQFEAEHDLAKKNSERSARLVKDGIIAQVDYDQALTTYRVAEKRVEAQKRAIELAQANVRSAQSGLKSSQANIGTQRARLQTLRTGARPEDISVAQKRVAETEKALRVAQQQAGNAHVFAPFAGRVTKVNAEPGQMVGANTGALGVLTLVSVEPEIRLDVDENNLSSLRIGQKAVVSSGAFSKSSFDATVSELGAAVDQARGTIEIKLIPTNTPVWLRPGQTVDVNIITAEEAVRLIVPQSSLVRSGDQTVVFVLENGIVVEKAVVTGALTKQGVPVISGLAPEEMIIADTAKLKAGDRARSA